MNQTSYYLATVSNATTQALRVQATSRNPLGNFAEAAATLAGYGLQVTSMQELTRDQYFAPNVAPVVYHIGEAFTVRPTV